MKLRHLLLTGLIASGAWAGPPAHVVIIGVDGMSPDGIQRADTPYLDRIMREGAHTFHGRAVFPSSSSPNWASMIMGAGPEQHGVHSNDWRVDKYVLAPVATGSGGFFPTVFDLFRRTHADGRSAVFYDWEGFGNLFAHGDVDHAEHLDGPRKVTEAATRYFAAEAPHLLFVHLDHVDHAGHDSGHGSEEYYRAVEEADEYIGRVLETIDRSPVAASTYLIVTSDHGGRGKGHGGWTMEEMEIPWMIWGPNVRPGHTLSSHVNTYDTAATAALLLDVAPHPAWVARAVSEAINE